MQICRGNREGQRSDHRKKERCINDGLGMGNNSRKNKSSTRKFVEGVADWYTLPRNNNGIGAVTSSRLLELISYEGQVLNSINYMGTRQENNYQSTSAGGAVFELVVGTIILLRLCQNLPQPTL